MWQLVAVNNGTYWHTHHWIIVVLIVLAVWELVWKAIALWQSAQHKQLIWFLVVLIINSAGILPIIYLGFFNKND